MKRIYLLILLYLGTCVMVSTQSIPLDLVRSPQVADMIRYDFITLIYSMLLSVILIIGILLT